MDEGFMQRMREVRIGDRYQLLQPLGAGTFGKVYLGRDVDTDKEVAVKLEHYDVAPSLLEEELELYKTLSSRPGFPSVYWDGWKDEYRVMVFELLGPNLEDLFAYCGRQFSLKTTLMLADQLLYRLQALHTLNITHCDIKPENFLLGIGKTGNQIYVTDLGLATMRYPERMWKVQSKVPDDGRPRDRPLHLVGTCRYASINAHFGETRPRDDLEALGYVLVYFMNGSLPWQGLRTATEEAKYKKVLEMKQQTSVSELCEGLPPAFVAYMDYVKSLKETDVADYRYLRSLFRRLFQDHHFEYDHVWDWTIREFERLQSL